MKEMMIAELNNILDDKNKKLSVKELKEIIYQLKEDRFHKLQQISEIPFETMQDKEQYRGLNGFYGGEAHAFQIALDLFERLDGKGSYGE